MSANQQWFIKTQSGKSGPFKFSELQYFADRGKIKPNTALSDGDSSWVKAKRVDGLYFPSEPPPGAHEEPSVMPDSAMDDSLIESSPFGMAPRESELDDVLAQQPPGEQPPSGDESGEPLSKSATFMAIDDRAGDASGRLLELAQREAAITDREAMLAGREAALATRESEFSDRETGLARREKTLRDREAKSDALEMEVRSRQSEVVCREADIELREAEVARREAELRRREAQFLAREAESAEGSQSLPRFKS